PLFASSTSTRMPLRSGSMGGEKGWGRTIPPVNRRAVAAAPPRLPSLSVGAIAGAALKSLHGSQASPMVSPSLSAWSGSATVGRQTPVLFASAGQWLPTPSQLSARSQGPAAARQTAVLFVSGGQIGSEPVQRSARSHGPAAARHSTVPGLKASAGQVGLDPV